ncbi:DUF4214 domain-containing protein [Cellulomonas hominis]
MSAQSRRRSGRRRRRPGQAWRAIPLALSLALVASPAAAGEARSTRVIDPATAAVVTAGAAAPAAAITPSTEPSVEQIAVTVPPVAADGTPQPTPGPTPAPTVTPSPTTEPGAPTEVLDVVAETPVADALQTPVVETDAFAMVGVTWPEGADVDGLAPQVRVRTGGEWSDWVTMETADNEPDPGTADAEAATAVRGGTEPLWVDDADAVQARFGATSQGGPVDLRVELVQPGEPDGAAPTTSGDAVIGNALSTGAAVVSNAVYTTSATATVPAALVAGAPAPPPIITRAQWGAPASTPCAPDIASTLVGAVIHHTASSNSYSTVDQAAAQIRSFYTYHTQSRGWCDIGYNFLVDKWGNIYEGRAGSISAPVIGVHTGGFNTGTVGVAMIGTYDATPSAATQQSVARVVGWRLGAYGVDPQGSMTYYTGAGENSRYQNQYVNLPRVFGHRDTAYTSCPGNGGYAALPNIRATAKQYAYDYTPLVRALYQDLLGRGADPSGLATWSGQLASGVSQSQLVATLTDSDEYIDRRITQTYQNILGRGPEPSGLAHWHRVVRAGVVSIDDLPLYFLASDELYARGGGTDEGFINVMYQQVLGRTAWQSERTYWAAFIPSGGRQAALNGIWISRESSQRRAGVYYQTFLGRAPDAGGLAMWTDMLMSRGESAVRMGIAGSEEYYNRALTRF